MEEEADYLGAWRGVMMILSVSACGILSSLCLFFFLVKKQGDDGVSVGWWLPGSGLGWGLCLVQEKFWLSVCCSFYLPSLF